LSSEFIAVPTVSTEMSCTPALSVMSWRNEPPLSAVMTGSIFESAS
jgi:hypothetical protein